MNKFEKYCNTRVLGEMPNGETGYEMTIGNMIDNGGTKEFFKIMRRTKEFPDGVQGKKVYYGLEYDKSEKAWYAKNWEDVSDWKKVNRNTRVFVGFTF